LKNNSTISPDRTSPEKSSSISTAPLRTSLQPLPRTTVLLPNAGNLFAPRAQSASSESQIPLPWISLGRVSPSIAFIHPWSLPAPSSTNPRASNSRSFSIPRKLKSFLQAQDIPSPNLPLSPKTASLFPAFPLPPQ